MSKPRKKNLFDLPGSKPRRPNGQTRQRCLAGPGRSCVAADRNLRIGCQDSLGDQRIKMVSDESAHEK